MRPQANSRSFSARGVDLFQPRAVISASARGLAWIRLFFVVDGPIRGRDCNLQLESLASFPSTRIYRLFAKKLSRSVLSLSTALLTLTNVVSRRLLLIILNEVVHLVLFTRLYGNSFTMILGPSNPPHLPRVHPDLTSFANANPG